MVVKSHVNDNNHATDKSVAEITCEPTDLSALSATPLARQHQAQKHYRSSDMLPHHARTQANETPVKIENQPASLAVEAAVAIVINGIHYAVLMASPHQLEYLALASCTVKA